MFYKDLLKIDRSCPFCDSNSHRIIKKEKEAFLIYSIVPYHKHHLLITPYRHIKDFLELNKKEIVSIDKLLHFGIKLLNILGYKDYNILLRNGDNNIKTVEHLHYHIIPVVAIGNLNHKGEERKVMTEKEMNKISRDFEVAKLKMNKKRQPRF